MNNKTFDERERDKSPLKLIVHNINLQTNKDSSEIQRSFPSKSKQTKKTREKSSNCGKIGRGTATSEESLSKRYTRSTDNLFLDNHFGNLRHSQSKLAKLV